MPVVGLKNASADLSRVKLPGLIYLACVVMLVMLMIVDGRMVEESERERSTLWGSHYDGKIRTRHGPEQ